MELKERQDLEPKVESGIELTNDPAVSSNEMGFPEYPEEEEEWDEEGRPAYVMGIVWSIVGCAIISGLLAIISYNTLWYSRWLFIFGGFLLGLVSYNTFKSKRMVVRIITAVIGALGGIFYLWLLDRVGFKWDDGKSLMDDMGMTMVMFAVGAFLGCSGASKIKDQGDNW